MSNSISTFRELLIFGEPDNASLVAKQMETINQNREGVKERSLKIILVNENSDLYKKYKVIPGNFIIILIGKDGSEKFRSEQVVEIEKIFAIIDAMPMRKAEIKGNDTNQ